MTSNFLFGSPKEEYAQHILTHLSNVSSKPPLFSTWYPTKSFPKMVHVIRLLVVPLGLHTLVPYKFSNMFVRVKIKGIIMGENDSYSPLDHVNK